MPYWTGKKQRPSLNVYGYCSRCLFSNWCAASIGFVFDLQTAWQLTFLGQVLLFGTTVDWRRVTALIGDEKTPSSSLSILFRLAKRIL